MARDGLTCRCLEKSLLGTFVGFLALNSPLLFSELCLPGLTCLYKIMAHSVTSGFLFFQNRPRQSLSKVSQKSLRNLSKVSQKSLNSLSKVSQKSLKSLSGSLCSEIKSLTDLMTEWQCHLLSYPGQLKIKWSSCWLCSEDKIGLHFENCLLNIFISNIQ